MYLLAKKTNTDALRAVISEYAMFNALFMIVGVAAAYDRRDFIDFGNRVRHVRFDCRT